MRIRLGVVLAVSVTACGKDDNVGADATSLGSADGTADGTSVTSADGTASASSSASTSASGGTGSSDDGVKFDLMVETSTGDTGDVPPSCKVVDDMDAVGDCTDEAPPDAFEPVTQWDFNGPPGFNESIVTPLVANMTDDNADGEIDLCDVPDVVVVAGPPQGDTPPARIYVLDGETGVPHFDTGAEMVQWGGTPALGDIDGDGLVEIVTSRPNGDGHLVAFEHDGTFKWQSTGPLWTGSQSSAVALADLDADGEVEIVAGANVFHADGSHSWTGAQGGDQIYSASAVPISTATA